MIASAYSYSAPSAFNGSWHTPQTSETSGLAHAFIPQVASAARMIAI